MIEQRSLRINGLDMHVELAGEGDPLLLLHGFPDSARVWRKLVPHLVAAGFRVIMPDQRGFGNTTAPGEVDAYSIRQIGADAIALLDVLGIGRAALMGHDWGSVIGWHLAAYHPDRFSAFVALAVGHPNALVGAGIGQRMKSWYVLAFQIPHLSEAALRAGNFALLGLMTDHEAEIANWRLHLSRPGRLTAALAWYRANFAALARGDFPPARIPVLGLIGSADIALTVAQMRNSGAFVQAPFAVHVLEGATHWLPLHEPAEVGRRAIGFFRDPR